MTNFFEQQARARTATKKLVFLYVLAVFSITASITFVAHILFMSGRRGPDPSTAAGLDFVIALFVLATIALGTIVRLAQIGGSGENVAEMLGGTAVDPSTHDPLERRLMNVVEEMAIASGIPVPRVYILHDEPGINAFAAGLKPGQAVIGITRGCLEQLTRDELQGVVAHEFSHIFNGDMRLNLRLMGVLGGILALATIGRLLFQVTPVRVRSRDDDDRGGSANALILFGIALFVIGYIGVFFARLIKAAVSRQREYLADSSAVQYTRNPEGIGSALMKIRAATDESFIRSHYAEEASHMFFGSALDFSSMFATHPPLEDRVGRISPTLLKSWVPHKATDESTPAAAHEVDQLATDALTALSNAAIGAAAARPLATPQPLRAGPPASARQVVASVGAPQAQDILAARGFLDSLPPAIRERTRNGQGAVLLVVSLFLETTEGTPKQIEILKQMLNEDEAREVLQIRQQISAIAETDRLTLLELSLPPLRQLTDDSKRVLLDIGNRLAHSEGELDLYEYVALALLEHQLFTKPRKPKPALSSQRTAQDLSIVLSAVAYAGADDIEHAKRAFDEGARDLNGVTFRSLDECDLTTITDAFERLSSLDPGAQRKVIEACAHAILLDGTITTKEAELLKGLCVVLEAPLPALAI